MRLDQTIVTLQQEIDRRPAHVLVTTGREALRHLKRLRDLEAEIARLKGEQADPPRTIFDILARWP